MDPHILHFYEDLELPISDIPFIIEAALTGKLVNPREKLDGQNFTFTVNSAGEVRFMGKGCSKWIRERGGLNRIELQEHFEDRKQIQAAFLGAYDALSSVVETCDKSLIEKVFRSGSIVIIAEVLAQANPNIVRYRKNTVCLVGCQELGTKLSPTLMPEQLLEFQKSVQNRELPNGWTIMGVPFVEFKGQPEIEHLIRTLNQEFETLIPRDSMNLCIGDLLTQFVEKELLKQGLPLTNHLLHRAARRLVYDDPSIMKSKEFPGKSWQAFKPIDDEKVTFVGDAIAPVEVFFRSLGKHVIDQYEFKVADPLDLDRVIELRNFAIKVKSALKAGRIIASERELKRIASACRRLDEMSYTRNAEGIVFTWRGQLRKLTGAFTGLNRLHGYFAFENAARIID